MHNLMPMLLYAALSFSLNGCATASAVKVASISNYFIEGLPKIGESPGGDVIHLGGFSGLNFEGSDSSGNLIFTTHPDRGPNAETKGFNKEGRKKRPFVLPKYQLELVKLKLNPKTHRVSLAQRIPLYHNNRPQLGIPFGKKKMPKGFSTEAPVTLLGKPVPYIEDGLDLEGIVKSQDGYYWMVEEYGPSIVKLNDKGEVLVRFVPKGSSLAHLSGKEVLPAYYSKRKMNRGFEGIALQGDSLFAFLQSPIPGGKNRLIRILQFDTKTETVTGEYLFSLDAKGAEKIGDAVSVGGGKFLVLEQNSKLGKSAMRKVVLVNLSKATNVLSPSGKFVSWETMDSKEFKAKSVRLAQKTVLIDLLEYGFQKRTKPEGITVISPSAIALVNDNDFGLQGDFSVRTGKLVANEGHPERSTLTVIRFREPLFMD